MTLRLCSECKKEISSDAKVCPNCGKKQDMGFSTRWLPIIMVFIVVGLIGKIASNDSSIPVKSTPVNQANTITPVDPKEDALSKMTLDFKWSKDEMNIMTANFVVKNESNHNIKDFEITCQHFANSGSNIDSNTRTIYDIVKAHSAKKFPHFNMGFINSQASSTSCKITDLTVLP